MSFFSWLFKEILEVLTIYVINILLFVFYYFVVPDYWFLCSLLTFVIFSAINIYCAYKKK